MFVPRCYVPAMETNQTHVELRFNIAAVRAARNSYFLSLQALHSNGKSNIVL